MESEALALDARLWPCQEREFTDQRAAGRLIADRNLERGIHSLAFMDPKTRSDA